MTTLERPVQSELALSEAELKQWEENGFVIREALFSPDECEALSAEAERLVGDESIPRGRRKFNALSLERGDENPAMHSVSRPDAYSEVFRSHVRDARLTEPVATLLGPTLMTQNNLFLFKAPGVGLPFPWHQDMWFFRNGLSTPTTVGTWQAMDNATIENGCLWVIPGSHRLPILEHDLPTEGPQQDEFRLARVAPCDEARAIAVEIPRGAVLFFHGFLLHKSGHNNTENPRRTYVAHYLSGEAQPHNADARPWPFTLARGEASSNPNAVQPDPDEELANIDRDWWQRKADRDGQVLRR